MFDFIPLPIYSAVYYHIQFALTLYILFLAFTQKVGSQHLRHVMPYFGMVYALFLILYMGLRPISGRYFVDMATYAEYFGRFQRGEYVEIKSDYLFSYLIKFCADIMSVHSFFLLLSILYILPCVLFSRKFFGGYWFFSFFLFVGSFSFWAAGTNGIRNGLATSIFLVALTYYNNFTIRYLFLFLSVGIHSSMFIPTAAFLVAGVNKNPKAYFWLWLACIPLTLVAGSTIQNFFGTMFTADERAADYLTKGNVNNDNFSRTGFRWDFLLYSAFAVVAGWYFIFKKNITDKFYVHLWGTYMIANAFWLLVIRANFSNRFAFLSWFLMAAVIAYPLLRYKLWPNQMKYIGWISAAYFMFTYLMFLIK